MRLHNDKRNGKGIGEPRIVVGGVPMEGASGRAKAEAGTRAGSRLPRLLVLCLTILALALGILGAGSLSSCSAGISAGLEAGGGANLAVSAEIPQPIAQKLRRMAQVPDGTALFDLAAVRKSLSTRKSLSVSSLSAPSLDSLKASILIRSLAEALSDPAVSKSGILTLTEKPGEAELRLRIGRDQAEAVFALFPGLDPGLVEALAPPALEDDPLTADEYRTVLASVFGDRLMPAFESAALSLTLSVPGEVLSSRGGSLSGRTLTLRIPLIDLLVMEKPIEAAVRWKR